LGGDSGVNSLLSAGGFSGKRGLFFLYPAAARGTVWPRALAGGPHALVAEIVDVNKIPQHHINHLRHGFGSSPAFLVNEMDDRNHPAVISVVSTSATKENTMARRPRFNLVGIPQHVIQRGNNRERCFFAENDYLEYLDSLAECAQRSECEIHAYALMTNHVHLLVTPHVGNSVPAMMQGLGRQYVRHINLEYRRTGTLWEGRYKACLVDPEQFLLACSCYIELNPVRTAIVKSPAEYRWSSYRHNACGEPTMVISPHRGFLQLGTTPSERQSAYRELFRQQMDVALLQEIREALSQELVLGTEKFKNHVEKSAIRQARPGKPGRPQQKDTDRLY
jgi:putative transposase